MSNPVNQICARATHLSARRTAVSLLWAALAAALPIPAALAAEEMELPSPSMSACKYSSLRFSHIDDIFDGCDIGTDAHQGGGGTSSNDEFSERMSDSYQRAAWEQTIMHGWDMAEKIESGESPWSSVQVDSVGSNSVFVIGDHEYSFLDLHDRP